MAKISMLRRDGDNAPADPLRAKLREAIGLAEVAKAALAQRISAIESAKELVSTSRDLLEASQAAVEKARKQQASLLAQRLSGSNKPALLLNTLAVARNKETHAADELSTAQGVLAELESGYEEILDAALVAGAGVEAAIIAIRAQVVRPWLVSLREAKVRAMEAVAVLSLLVHRENYTSSSYAERAALDDAIKPLLELKKLETLKWLETSWPADDGSEARIAAARSAWSLALENLKSDPTAALPELKP
jgi:hypothetical protein